jgi:hypothetical protein
VRVGPGARGGPCESRPREPASFKAAAGARLADGGGPGKEGCATRAQNGAGDACMWRAAQQTRAARARRRPPLPLAIAQRSDSSLRLAAPGEEMRRTLFGLRLDLLVLHDCLLVLADGRSPSLVSHCGRVLVRRLPQDDQRRDQKAAADVKLLAHQRPLADRSIHHSVRTDRKCPNRNAAELGAA